MSKIYDAIQRLPDNPVGKVIWVCYNEDMKVGATDLIKLLKGEHYIKKCDVISRDYLKENIISQAGKPLQIYYSPDMMDHIGNGAN